MLYFLQFCPVAYEKKNENMVFPFAGTFCLAGHFFCPVRACRLAATIVDNGKTRYATHPQDSMLYTTEELRSHYLIEEVFVKDEANFVYSHNDRIIADDIFSHYSKVELGSTSDIGT